MIGQKEEASNLLEELLYQSSPSNISRKKYDRGLFVSINNHKQGNDDLYASIKKQYQSLMYALTGKNISRDAIRVTDKLPQQKVILDCLAEKNVFAAAALHSYNAYDIRTGRGSNFNYGGYSHLHLYAYGVCSHMHQHNGGCEAALEHIKRCLYRHNNFSSQTSKNNIVIKEVGAGKYQYNDVVSPTTLHHYLSLPKTNPAKECVINYMAGTLDDAPQNPIIYIYTRGN